MDQLRLNLRVSSYLERPLYSLVKQWVEQYGTAHQRQCYRLDWLSCLYSIPRLLLIWVLTFPQLKDSPLVGWDSASVFAWNHPEMYDQFVPWIVALLDAFDMYCHYALAQVKVDKHLVWSWWYQLIVENQDSYYRCRLRPNKMDSLTQQKQIELNSRLKAKFPKLFGLLPELFQSLYCYLHVKITVWYRLENVNQPRLFQGNPLASMPNLSDELRARVLLISIVADKILHPLLQFIVFIWLIFAIAMIYVFNRNYPWPYHLWTTFDLCVFGIQLIRLLKCVVFFTMVSLLARIVMIGHVRALSSQVMKLFQTVQQPDSGQLASKRLHLTLGRFLRGHNRVCYVISAGNQQLFGSVMFAFVLTNVPINIYMISRLLLMKNSIQVLIVFNLVIGFQLLAGAIVMGPMAATCTALHKPTKLIPPLQAFLSRKTLLRELKLLNLYALLSSGPKFGICVGDVKHPITWMLICEVT